MLHPQRVFALSQLVEVATPPGENPPDDDQDASGRRLETLSDFATSAEADLVAMVTSRGRLLTWTRSASRLNEVPWWSGEDVRPARVALSPENDFLLACGRSGDHLFVCPSPLAAPGFQPKGECRP